MATINAGMYDACNDDEVIASSRGRITHAVGRVHDVKSFNDGVYAYPRHEYAYTLYI